jgi:RNA polymerase sigma factor (sigma-70 family)
MEVRGDSAILLADDEPRRDRFPCRRTGWLLERGEVDGSLRCRHRGRGSRDDVGCKGFRFECQREGVSIRRAETWVWVMVAVARSSRSTRTDLLVVAVPRDGGHGFAGFYNTELAGQVRRAALLIGDRDDARDLVHDAFIEIYRRWDELDDPGPYLSRVVLNRCRDRARNAARQRRVPVVSAVVGSDAADDSVDDETLWAALQHLPFNHRAVLVLRFHHQLTTNEIAEALGCRPGSVGPWIDRGLRRLRRDLQ